MNGSALNGISPLPHLRMAILIALMAVSAAVLGGCGSSYAPGGWLPTAEQATCDGFGAYVHLDLARAPAVEGELIAASSDSVYVLYASDTAERLFTVGRGDIFYLEGDYASSGTRVGEYTVLFATELVAAPITTGWYSGLIILATIPAWIIDVAHLNNAHRFSYFSELDKNRRNAEWEALSQWARFPQGLPPLVNRAELRPKPVWKE